jgi:hypothetical protein
MEDILVQRLLFILDRFERSAREDESFTALSMRNQKSNRTNQSHVTLGQNRVQSLNVDVEQKVDESRFTDRCCFVL